MALQLIRMALISFPQVERTFEAGFDYCKAEGIEDVDGYFDSRAAKTLKSLNTV